MLPQSDHPDVFAAVAEPRGSRLICFASALPVHPE